MSLANFIPELWAARLLSALRNQLVYAQPGVINRDYEGDIQQAGDTVRINAIGDPTIGNYTKNTDIAAPEQLTDAQSTLLIDQQKYFNFQVDDVDAAQQRPKVMDEAMGRAAYQLANTADQFIAALYTNISTTNVTGSDGTPIVPTSTTAYENLVDLTVLLDQNNVPTDGRWCIVPPWYHGMLLKDQRFVSFGTPENLVVLHNGFIGQVAGMNILKSNNVPATTGTKYKIIAGHPMAWSYAEQVSKVEAYRPPLRFADAMKGLHVYGGKVLRPYALAVSTVNKT